MPPAPLISAEMFIVVALMFAVFAAVAAVGTSIVLGVGFERLRNGFEIIKKQTGFFSDAIHKLDQKTDAIQQSVSGLSTRMDNVEKQSTFFFESLTSLESKILKGSPAQNVQNPIEDMEEVKSEEPAPKEKSNIVAPNIDWSMTSDTARLIKKRHNAPKPMQPEKPMNSGLSSMLVNYLMNDNSPDKRDVVYH